MKLIVGFRPQAYPGGKKNEFVIYNPKTKIGNKDIVRSKIISYIEKNNLIDAERKEFEENQRLEHMRLEAEAKAREEAEAKKAKKKDKKKK